jgi:hypothetical protein
MPSVCSSLAAIQKVKITAKLSLACWIISWVTFRDRVIVSRLCYAHFFLEGRIFLS